MRYYKVSMPVSELVAVDDGVTLEEMKEAFIDNILDIVDACVSAEEISVRSLTVVPADSDENFNACDGYMVFLVEKVGECGGPIGSYVSLSELCKETPPTEGSEEGNLISAQIEEIQRMQKELRKELEELKAEFDDHFHFGERG